MAAENKFLRASTPIVLLAISSVFFAGLCFANPTSLPEYRFMDEVPPDSQTEPPVIQVLSPSNNSVHGTSKVSFLVNVEVGHSATAALPPHITYLYYEADWREGSTHVYYGVWIRSVVNKSITLKDIPAGNHTLKLYAGEGGRYEKTVPDNTTKEGYVIEAYPFRIGSSISIHFAVDTSPPAILDLKVETDSLNSSEVKVNFSLNKQAKQVSYRLDGLENVTVAGNFTLSSLPSGLHNLTVYATNDAGNTRASETITFIVPSISDATPTQTAYTLPSPTAIPSNEPTASSQNSLELEQTGKIAIAPIGLTVAVVLGLAATAVYLRRKRIASK